MIHTETMKVAWIRDKDGLWLRVATAALRRHEMLDEVKAGSREGDGFYYLDAASARRVLRMIRRKGQRVNERPPPKRFAKHAVVRNMARVNQSVQIH